MCLQAIVHGAGEGIKKGRTAAKRVRAYRGPESGLAPGNDAMGIAGTTSTIDSANTSFTAPQRTGTMRAPCGYVAQLVRAWHS